MKSCCVKNGLVVAVILLFIGVGIQPSFADVSNTSISDNEDDCNLCPKVSKKHLVILMNLLKRLEILENKLSVISKQNPIAEEKYQDLSIIYIVIKDKTEVLELQRPKILRYSLCVITFYSWVIILTIPLFIAYALSGTMFEYVYWSYILMPLLYVCQFTTRFVCKPFLPEE